MALKCIQHTMKENLLLLNNLLELSKTRFLSTWQPFQRMFMSHDMPDDIVNKYNNRVHRMIKMKPLTLHLILMLNTMKILTKKILNWKLVIVSEYQNTKTFLHYTQNWSEEVSIISKIKNTVPWTYVISDLNGEKIDWTFYEKELQKTNQKEFKIQRVIKRKGDKLYVKCKAYDNSFNSWINKKDLVQIWVNTFLSCLEVLEKMLMLKLMLCNKNWS